MIPLADAQAAIDATVTTLPPASVPLADAHGLVLVDDLRAPENLPVFANSAMDGYAVHAADTKPAPHELEVVGEVAAGSAPSASVGPGQAVRIMTGAPVPDGADAIVMVERTERIDDAAVRVLESVDAGQHVRAAGSDLSAGAVAIEAGTIMGAAQLGVAAAVGAGEVTVVRRARVGVVSTGDELVATEPGKSSALAPGQIRDANRPMLLAMVAESGAEPVDLGIVGDDDHAVERAVHDACGHCDVLLTSGGVSMGDYDVVKAVLARLGSEQHWWQVAIKPAKPLSFAVVNGVPCFGLPGNPVSSLVSFELFARPAIRARMGYRRRHRPIIDAVAGTSMPRAPDGKVHLDRVVLSDGDGRLVATPVRAQASHTLAATASANGLVFLPDGDGIEAGAPVRVMRLDG